MCPDEVSRIDKALSILFTVAAEQTRVISIPFTEKSAGMNYSAVRQTLD